MTLVYDALDPFSDIRMSSLSSVRIKVHPSATGALKLGPAPDLAARLEGMRPDLVPLFVEERLAGLGIGLHLTGDERLPGRPEVWDLLDRFWDHDSATKEWAQASVRMANTYALVIRGVARLSISTDALAKFLDEHGERTRAIWARADPFPVLRVAALANEALLEHWIGESDKALAMLDYLERREISDWDRRMVDEKRIIILVESERLDEARSLLASLPERRCKGTMGRIAKDLGV